MSEAVNRRGGVKCNYEPLSIVSLVASTLSGHITHLIYIILASFERVARCRLKCVDNLDDGGVAKRAADIITGILTCLCT